MCNFYVALSIPRLGFVPLWFPWSATRMRGVLASCFLLLSIIVSVPEDESFCCSVQYLNKLLHQCNLCFTSKSSLNICDLALLAQHPSITANETVAGIISYGHLSRHLSICTVRLEGTLAHATPPHCLHGPELAVIEGRLFSQKEEHKISYDWLIGMACAQLVLELVG